MATNIGPRIGIDGEAQYRKQINLIVQQAKTLSSEMLKVTSAFTKNTTAQERATETGKVLQKQIETQRERVRALTEMLEKSKKETGENSIATQKWQEVVNRASAELNRMENELAESADASDDLGDSLEDASGSAFSFGDALKANVLAQAIVDGVKRLASQIKDLSVEFVNVAAAVKAETSQFEQTFGAMGDTASAAIRRVAEESGILQTRLNSAGTRIYAFAKASGGDAAESLDIMERALSAAADSAAYYDRSLEETVDSLQSFLKGNYENDAALGLSATETTRNAAAMELFGQKFNDLTEIQKQDTLLTMVENAQQLSGAMGQAAREADGWENVQGNLNEAWRQFQAMAGAPFLESLVPIIQKITQSLIEWTESVDWEAFSESVTGFVDALVQNGNTIVSMISAIGAAFVAWNVASMIQGVVTAINAFRAANEGASIAQAALNVIMAANPIGIVISAIAAIVAALVAFMATNEDVRNDLISAWGSIKEMAGDLVNVLTSYFTAFDNFLKSVFAADWTNVFGPLLGGVMNGFFHTLSEIWESIKRIFNGVLEFVKGVFTGDWRRAWQGVVDIFGGIFDGIKAAAKAPLNALIGLLNGAIGAINRLISGFNGIGFTMPKWLGGGSFHPNIPTIPSIPYLADGGTVRSGYAIVGEAGPELLRVGPNGTRVTPLSAGERAQGLGFGGITINVYGAEGQDVEELADIVSRRLETRVRQIEGAFA